MIPLPHALMSTMVSVIPKPIIVPIRLTVRMTPMAMTILRPMIAIQFQDLGTSQDVPMRQRAMAILRATVVIQLQGMSSAQDVRIQ